jgi:AcrR family transcriptional regulator
MPKVTETYLETRRQHILDAAITCFARKGFHQTTMEEIGQEAGLSPGLAYRYFASKEDIIFATIQDGLERWARFYETQAEEEDTLRVLEQMLDDHLQRLEQPGGDKYYKVRIQFWAEALQNPKVAEKAYLLRQAAQEQIIAVIRRGQEKGQIDPDLDATTVSLTISANHDGFVLQWLADPNVDINKYRKVFMAMMRGLFNHQG